MVRLLRRSRESGERKEFLKLQRRLWSFEKTPRALNEVKRPGH